MYLSDQAHASNARALDVLGFAPEQVRRLPSDGAFRLPPAALREAVRADLAAGRRPFCVVATAGTTSTGASIRWPSSPTSAPSTGCGCTSTARTARPRCSAPPGAALLAGLERADSLVLDPHKWLFQPYELGCVLVREPGLLERTFALDGAYLRDVTGGEVNFRDRSLQLTRGGRALKLWLSVRVFGLAAFRDAVARGIALAEHAEALLAARPGWEVVTPAQLGIVCFRRGDDDGEQTRIAARWSATATRRRARPCSTAASCCGSARSTRARRSRTSSARSSGWSPSKRSARAIAAIVSGPVPQQPPMPRAPRSRQPATALAGNASTPAPLHSWRARSHVRPLFG